MVLPKLLIFSNTIFKTSRKSAYCTLGCEKNSFSIKYKKMDF